MAVGDWPLAVGLYSPVPNPHIPPMTQRQLNTAVAHVTGESRRCIADLGFNLADPLVAAYDPEPYFDPEFDNYLDWDRVEEDRIVMLP
jgi:hypothetical protein